MCFFLQLHINYQNYLKLYVESVFFELLLRLKLHIDSEKIRGLYVNFTYQEAYARLKLHIRYEEDDSLYVSSVFISLFQAKTTYNKKEQ